MSSSDSENESDVEMILEKAGLVTPGEMITDDTIWMRGHGTYAADNVTYSAVAGTIERVNKLLSVRPLRGRYIPVIGDHVVGRITEVGNRRWKVDIGASQDAVLMLGSVNLPGGILRRKSDDDELQMREFLKEGDLLNAEIQTLYADGAAALHTRSLRYGKLRNGLFVQVPASLVLRLRTQVYRLEGGIEMILGINGYIWIRKATSTNANAAPMDVSINRLEQESNSMEIYKDENDPIPPSTRQTISRYANCIQALVYNEVGINEARLRAVYEASMVYTDAGELLDNTVKTDIVKQAMATL